MTDKENVMIIRKMFRHFIKKKVTYLSVKINRNAKRRQVAKHSYYKNVLYFGYFTSYEI